MRTRISTLATLLVLISGCLPSVTIAAEKQAMNQTAIFLGSKSEWQGVGVELTYAHGLYGISNIYISGSGKVLYQTARYAGGELLEKRYVLDLDKEEVRRLVESFIANDFTGIRTKDRVGVPDEGKPDISLINPLGQTCTVSVWTGIDFYKDKESKEAAQRFKAVHDEIIRIQRQAEERLEPIYTGKYKPGSWGEAKSSILADKAEEALIYLDHLDMVTEVSNEAADKYRTSNRIEFHVSGRCEGKGETAKIILEGRLLNPTPNALPVIHYPEDGINPFYAYIISDSKVALKPRTDLLTQIPSYRKPNPRSIQVRAGMRIIFSREINLKDYAYVGNPEARVYWRFNFWDRPMEGKIAIQVPSK